MVNILDNTFEKQSQNEQKNALSLWDRVKDITKRSLTTLEKRKDTLTETVVLETTSELKDLHGEILSNESLAEAPHKDFDNLKQEVIETRQKIVDETNIQDTWSGQQDRLSDNNSIDWIDTSFARVQEWRASAANRIATMIDEDLFDSSKRSLF